MFVHTTPRSNWHELDDEEFFIIEGREKCGATQRKFSQTAKKGALVEIMSTSNVRTALREAATRSIDCAHFYILQDWRANASGFEFTAT